MDTTAWVAIAGIAGTFLAPLATERMRRKSARTDRLLTERIRLYADLLRVTARASDNAMMWSSIPLADLQETDEDELDRILSLARVVASKKVYTHLTGLWRQASDFNRQLTWARMHHQRVRDQGEVDDVQAIRERMSLGAVAGKLRESFKQLEAVIRSEMAD